MTLDLPAIRGGGDRVRLLSDLVRRADETVVASVDDRHRVGRLVRVIKSLAVRRDRTAKRLRADINRVGDVAPSGVADRLQTSRSSLVIAIGLDRVGFGDQSLVANTAPPKSHCATIGPSGGPTYVEAVMWVRTR